MTHLAQELILWELSGEPLLDQSFVRSVRLGDPDQQLVTNSGPRPPKPKGGRWGEKGESVCARDSATYVGCNRLLLGLTHKKTAEVTSTLAWWNGEPYCACVTKNLSARLNQRHRWP